MPAACVAFRPLRALLPIAALLLVFAAQPALAARGTAEWVLLEQSAAHGKRTQGKRSQGKAQGKHPSVRLAAKSRKPQVRRAAPRRAQPVVTAPAALVPSDPLWRDSWSLAKANAPSAWRTTTGLSETVVAVLDTGVDLTHPDLQGAFVEGYDTVNEDSDPTDDHGHGTMVAGVIGARANNGIGGVGACWRCSLMPVKVIAGNGLGNAVDVAEGITWATDHGARVINMSFTLSVADDAVAAALEHARTKGVLVVAAAGNAGTAEATFPASYPGVVSVAGADPGDARYAWSSYGSWVRLAAPGCNWTTAPGAGYGDFCGTSSATAFVSGLAGLARSYAPALSPDAIGQALTAGAVTVDFAAAGRVDAGAVITSLRP